MSMNQKTRTSQSKRVQTITLVLVLLMGIGMMVMLQTKDGAQALLEKGDAAPDFTLPDLDGKMVRLSDQKGKVVFLNIWATWCPPCVEEMPSMEKLHQALKDEDFQILAVSIDKQGAEAVRPFMKQHKLNFTALVDKEETTKSAYQTTGVPETFIIDRDGIIIEKVIGPRNWASPEAIEYFRNLLQRK